MPCPPSPQHPTRHPHHNSLQRQMSQPSDIPRPRAAARLIHSVKRTLSPSAVAARKAHAQYTKETGMQSTVAESASAVLPQQQQFRESNAHPSRPTIEQIAMGLHISRTPHLRPLASSPYAFSQRNSAPHSANPYEHQHRATPITLPPPPTRSSLKKPSTDVTSSSSSPALSPPFSSASGSTTTVTSAAPSSSLVHGSFAAIKFRVARLLPHTRSVYTPSPSHPPPTSPRASSSDSIQPRKEVRFKETNDSE